MADECASADRLGCRERCEAERLRHIRSYLAKMWRRARINAFAHRFARDEYQERARKYLKWQILYGLSAIVTVILVYAVPAAFDVPREIIDNGAEVASERGNSQFDLAGRNDAPFPVGVWAKSLCTLITPSNLETKALCDRISLDIPILRLFQLLFAMASVMCSSASLYYAIRQAEEKNDGLLTAHGVNMQLFISIAQRTQRLSYRSIELHDALRVKSQLDEEFEHLKGRGPEPSDENFEKANKLFKRIARDAPKGTQSFESSLDQQEDGEEEDESKDVRQATSRRWLQWVFRRRK